MISWKWKISILVLSLVVFGASLLLAFQKKETGERIIPSSEYLKSSYFTEKQFNQTIRLAEQLAIDFPAERIKAGIVPHDLRHAEYIAHFLKNLKNQSPETILLIGPNHREFGHSSLITASNYWQTYFGVLQTNQELINILKEKGLVSDEPWVVEQDHTIAGIVPYIAYYLPKTKIVPLIFKSEFGVTDIENLVSSLENILPKSIVIIAAVDFSHYLTSRQAEESDKVTAKALADFDYQKILSFGERFNDYVDSPPSIAFLMLWMQKQGVKNIEILANTNSGKLEHRETEPVTSYFEAIYY